MGDLNSIYNHVMKTYFKQLILKYLKIAPLALGAALLIGFNGAAPAISAQEIENEKAAMAKLDFLRGHWVGPGLSYTGVSAESSGTARPYVDTEIIRYDLDGKIMLINASGQRDGQISYQLHTIIYYDVDKARYIYTPYAGKAPRSFECDLVNAALICLTEAKTFRLTFQRLPDGRWNEFGERLFGNIWRKTFETKLNSAN